MSEELLRKGLKKRLMRKGLLRKKQRDKI